MIEKIEVQKVTNKGGASGFLAGGLAVAIAMGGVGLMRGVTKAGSKVVREVGQEATSIRPASVLDESPIQRRITEPFPATHASDDVVSMGSVTQDIETDLRAKYGGSQNLKRLFASRPEQDEETNEVLQFISDIASDVTQDRIKSYFESQENDASSREALDAVIYSEEFLFRASDLYSREQYYDAAEVQDFVVRVLAFLTQSDPSYAHALSFSLASKTWYSVLNDDPNSALRACEWIRALPPQFVHESDLQVASVNCAHANLLIGHESKALIVYRSVLSERGSEDWQSILENDYEAMMKAGLNEEALSTLLTLLNEFSLQ